jgi:hypothetical protein
MHLPFGHRQVEAVQRCCHAEGLAQPLDIDSQRHGLHATWNCGTDRRSTPTKRPSYCR